MFKFCIKKRQFLSEWKKANVIQGNKKGDKPVSRNYLPVLLLPICGKIFERFLYSSLVGFFH